MILLRVWRLVDSASVNGCNLLSGKSFVASYPHRRSDQITVFRSRLGSDHHRQVMTTNITAMVSKSLLVFVGVNNTRSDQ